MTVLQEKQPEAEFIDGKGTLHAIDASGDTRTMWDSQNEEEVKAARKLFDRLKKKGFLAYKAHQDGSPGEVLQEFDPDAQAIVMRPQLVGG